MRKAAIVIFICILMLCACTQVQGFFDDTAAVSPSAIQDGGTTPTQTAEITQAQAPTQTPTPEPTEEIEVTATYMEPQESLTAFAAGDVIDVSGWSEKQLESFFFGMEIDDNIFARIDGITYPKDCPLPLDSIRYIRVLHIGFDDLTHIGELMVNAEIADDIIYIFRELYADKYQIERMRLIDDYGGDDELSMADNNTSAFNYRFVNNSTTLSNHAYGLAIDINPLYNPYVRERENGTLILPSEGEPYTDRLLDLPYYITHESVIYTLFTERGFKWGGDWNTVKDYQHFEKTAD